MAAELHIPVPLTAARRVCAPTLSSSAAQRRRTCLRSASWAPRFCGRTTAFDPQRFMAPRGDPEAGYAWFLGSQLKEDDVAVFVAERAGVVIGYVYAGMEPQSWKELREAAGFFMMSSLRRKPSGAV